MSVRITSNEVVCPPAHRHRRAVLLGVAGLVHDLGKVLEPARVELTDVESNLERMVCPTDRATGRATHRHALYTAALLTRTAGRYGSLDANAIFGVASHHHRPRSDSVDDAIIQLADHLASGHDRAAHDDATQPVFGCRSIFATLPEASSVPGDLRTGAIAFDDSFLPSSAQARDEYAARCADIATTLERELGFDESDDVRAVDRLLGLLLRTTTRIAASRSRGDLADVSLFDHSRMVGALGAAIAYADPTEPPRRDAVRFRLLAIRVGGVQRFIFRDHPPADGVGSADKGRAKRLRARSFVVSLLSFLAARRVLETVGLPMTNLLLDAGGNATLLLPDHPDAVHRAESAMSYLRAWALARFGDAVRLEIGLGRAFTGESLVSPNLAQLMHEVPSILARARLRVPSSTIGAQGWRADGWVIAEGVGHPVDDPAFARRIDELGARLPRATALRLDGDDGSLELFGYRIGLETGSPTTTGFSLAPDRDGVWTAPAFVVANHVPKAGPDDLGGDDEDDPQRIGETLTFGTIACRSCDGDTRLDGLAMLGALKADVDHLGRLITLGLGTRESLGRRATLSRSLDLFFRGFLDRRLEDSFPSLYTVFSGGDDLFVIGPWLDVVRYTSSLNRWFRAFVCDHPRVTLSAGITFTAPGAPVRALADAADAALERAKQPDRNHVVVAGARLTWSQLDRALALRGTIVDGVRSDRGVNTSLVHRLLSYADMAMRCAEPGDRVDRRSLTLGDLKWRSQLSYDIKRNLPVGRDETDGVQSLRTFLVSITAADAPVLHVAATLALYTLRGLRT